MVRYGWYAWYGTVGTVGTHGTVRLVRLVRLVRYGWYAWYGAVGLRLVRMVRLVRYGWYAWYCWYGTVGTAGTAGKVLCGTLRGFYGRFGLCVKYSCAAVVLVHDVGFEAVASSKTKNPKTSLIDVNLTQCRCSPPVQIMLVSHSKDILAP